MLEWYLKALLFITLFSDNVNKVPRDLKEVGAQDLQFSSSANLYGRVFNTTFEDDTPTNSQFIPSTTPDKVVSIGLRDENWNESRCGWSILRNVSFL